MVWVLKLATPYYVKRVKRNNKILICEAPKRIVARRRLKGMNITFVDMINEFMKFVFAVWSKDVSLSDVCIERNM